MAWIRRPEDLGTPEEQEAAWRALANLNTYHEKNTNPLDQQATFKQFVDDLTTGKLNLTDQQIIELLASSDPTLRSWIKDYVAKHPAKSLMSLEQQQRLEAGVKNDVFGVARSQFLEPDGFT